MNKALVVDQDLFDDLIQERKNRGIDRYDEVWEGVYVMPSVPNLDHQKLVHDVEVILDIVIVQERDGKVYPGANVSDRRTRWKENFRVPDVVVVLKNSRAVNCLSHLFGGPDFLVEIESHPGEMDAKIPFYERIQVQELLIIERDSRQLRLFRHDGQHLTLVDPTSFQGGKWLVSQVLSLAFRRKTQRGEARTEIRRTDGKPGHWTV